MRIKTIFLALLGLFFSALSLSAQTPVNLSYLNFHPYYNGEIKYKIWAEVSIAPNTDNPQDPPPPPPPGGGGQPPPTKPPIEHLYDPMAMPPVDPYVDPGDPSQPPGGGGGGGGGSTPPPSLPKTELLMETYYYHSPRGTFNARTISESQAIAYGVNPDIINDIKNTPNFEYVNFKESCLSLDNLRNSPYTNASAYAASNIARGTVVINATIPPHSGSWAIKITDALANERIAWGITLQPGQNTLIITDINAGNTLVALFAVGSGGISSTYFQEAYALIEKNQTTNINIQFTEDEDINRYRIGYLGMGQSSQSVLENLPLQKDRDAMVRVMVYDAYGLGIQPPEDKKLPVRITWSLPGYPDQQTTFNTFISGYHARSGRIVNENTDIEEALGPIIPAQYIKPGLMIKAELLANDSDNAEILDTKGPTLVTVLKPRHIYINGYQMKPLFGSGVPVARNNTRWRNEIMPFVSDVFPYSKISYTYRGSICVPGFGNLGPLGALLHHTNTVLLMNARSLLLPTDLVAGILGLDYYVLNLGITNARYSKGGTQGMCYFWKPGISLAAAHGRHQQDTAYTLAHEMGHAFGLEHAPFSGGNEGLNRIDNNYPYSGAGMAGGWGYADIRYRKTGESAWQEARHFLSEDAHTLYRGHLAHWDTMVYLSDNIKSNYNHKDNRFRHYRFSDYNARKIYRAFRLSTPDPVTSISQMPDIPPECFSILPGTDTLIFGPEAAHAMEEAWYQMHGLRSVHAVDPSDIPNTALDFDITTLEVTSEGKIIFPTDILNAIRRPEEWITLPGFETDEEESEYEDGEEEDDDEEDDEPPVMIVTRLPRLLGFNVNN